MMRFYGWTTCSGQSPHEVDGLTRLHCIYYIYDVCIILDVYVYV